MKRIGFIVLAGLAAALVALVVHSALRSKDAELLRARVQTTDIVVAAHELPIGTKLAGADVRVVRWPRESMPGGATADPRSVLGGVVKVAMVENEPIVTSRLFSGDTAGILSLVIPPDKRAMSVAVDEVSDIAGFVLPHARVDVLVALREQGMGQESAPQAKIVLENVEVMAVAQTTEQKDKPQVEKVVTLLVSPEEAERLALASHEGSLRLALRNYNDTKIVTTQGSTVSTMLASYGGVSMPPRPMVGQQVRTAGFAPQRPPAPGIKVEVMRDGTSRDAVNFGLDGREVRPVEAPQRPQPPFPPAQAQAAPYRAAQAPVPQPPPYAPAAAPVQAASSDGAVRNANGDVVAFQGPDAKTIEMH
jgi:pilus assembly protein CpaB